jgi:hypothetical protein
MFDLERKTVFKGMRFLAHRTVEYREEKVQTCMKMPHYIQRQAQFRLVCMAAVLESPLFVREERGERKLVRDTV